MYRQVQRGRTVGPIKVRRLFGFEEVEWPIMRSDCGPCVRICQEGSCKERTCSILIYVSFGLQFTSSYSFLHLFTSLTKVLYLFTSSYISLQLLISLFFHKFVLLNFDCCKYYLKKPNIFLPKKISK